MPPPYKGIWKRIAEKGIYEGDPLADAAYAEFQRSFDRPKKSQPNKSRNSNTSSVPSDDDNPEDTTPSKTPSIPALKRRPSCPSSMNPLDNDTVFCNPKNMLPTPSWVDEAKIKRGQQFMLKHIGKWAVSLGHSLLVGFSFVRFAVVLHRAGYAQSAEGAAKRYVATLYHMIDWFQYDIVKDKTGRGLRSLYTVRALHAHARKVCKPLFLYEGNKEKRDIGIPLCQYDMATVLLDFCMIAFSMVEVEFKYGKFPDDEMDDVVHLMRLIGYHLGIKDEYNICSEGLAKARQYTDEFILWMPRAAETSRRESKDLRDAAIGGFAITGGTSVRVWNALFINFCSHSPRLDCRSCVTDPKQAFYICPSNYTVFLRLYLELYLTKVMGDGHLADRISTTIVKRRNAAAADVKHDKFRAVMMKRLSQFTSNFVFGPMYLWGNIVESLFLNGDAQRAVNSRTRDFDDDKRLARNAVAGLAGIFTCLGIGGAVIAKQFDVDFARIVPMGIFSWIRLF